MSQNLALQGGRPGGAGRLAGQVLAGGVAAGAGGRLRRRLPLRRQEHGELQQVGVGRAVRRQPRLHAGRVRGVLPVCVEAEGLAADGRQASQDPGRRLVSSKALSFCCASTVFLSKTVPFRAVPLDQLGQRWPATRRRQRAQLAPDTVRCKALLSFCCASTVFLSKTVPFRAVLLSVHVGRATRPGGRSTSTSSRPPPRLRRRCRVTVAHWAAQRLSRPAPQRAF
eukprot:SAG22_NODE_63_length_23302_cov_17.506551_8_plen_225_part_00